MSVGSGSSGFYGSRASNSVSFSSAPKQTQPMGYSTGNVAPGYASYVMGRMAERKKYSSNSDYTKSQSDAFTDQLEQAVLLERLGYDVKFKDGQMEIYEESQNPVEYVGYQTTPYDPGYYDKDIMFEEDYYALINQDSQPEITSYNQRPSHPGYRTPGYYTRGYYNNGYNGYSRPYYRNNYYSNYRYSNRYQNRYYSNYSQRYNSGYYNGYNNYNNRYRRQYY